MKELAPIIILGAARSGTTILGELLSCHPDIYYFLEPRYIWRYGNAHIKHDRLTPENLNAAQKKYIINWFQKRLERSGKKYMLEKTPSSTLRVSYINEIFPNALFINIIRDGNDVTLSAIKKWTSAPSRSALKRRLFSNEIPLKDLHLYIFYFLKQYFIRIFNPQKGIIWGPTFEGMEEYRKKHTIAESCAMQWVKCVETTSKELQDVPSERQLEIRYEDLISLPNKTLEKILDFINLSDDESFQEKLAGIFKRNKPYSEKEIQILKEVEPILRQTRRKFDYQ